MRHGKAKKEKFSMRIRFNWGFHDATYDVSRGQPRFLRMAGFNDLKAVSRTHDVDYYRGYSAGLDYAKAGTYAGTSEPAWLDMVKAGVYTSADSE